MTEETTASLPAKPVPVLGDFAEPFWEGTKRGKLVLQRCCKCGKYQWFRRAMCVECLSDDLEWIDSKGEGRIYSYTVTYRGPSKAFKDPYVIALIEWPEGIRVMSNIVNIDPEAVAVDMPVRVTFEPRSAEITIIQFEPAAGKI